MPGYVEHTNEVLVPLGKDYFVWRSTHQATEIIERRLDGGCNSLGASVMALSVTRAIRQA